ncbi:MAG: sigma-54-dependent Fis family transcriptional regulator [Kordiimonadaceae bacterium]|nr:sigma-54-dependent Fis family transcriptional regulator [Kordiimonadaceae bacterium]
MIVRSDANILLVEDTLSLALVYENALIAAGYRVTIVEDGAAALDALSTKNYGLMLLDLQLPDMDGTAVLEQIKGTSRELPVIVATSDASINRAIQAMQLGALDYIVKPFSEERLLTTVGHTLERAILRKTVATIENEIPTESFQGFVGESLPMKAVFRAIKHVSRSKATVFVTGESGTGKEVAAESIHREGPRTDKPFVALNCAAIPRDLIESELFGHKKGSFTGAIADREGAAKRANGGTLFLDEVCEMDINLQTKLLRFLQTEKIQAVGAPREERVDVRVICATNRDPAAEVEAGRFREDLFYRLNVIPVNLPPLRDRNGDVMLLAQHFLEKYSEEENKAFEGFDAESDTMLRLQKWPGNVRELQNVIRNITVMHTGPIVTAGMLPEQALISATPPTLSSPTAVQSTPHGIAGLTAPSSGLEGLPALLKEGSLDDIERMLIEGRIAAHMNSIPKAAESLGVSPSTIYRKKEKWEERKGPVQEVG